MAGSSRWALVLLLCLLVAGLKAGAPLQSPAPLSGAAIYQQTLPAVAWVLAADKGKGTGFLIDRERRWLITGYHVVGNNRTAEVVFPVIRDKAPIAERDYYLQHRAELQQAGCWVQARVLERDRGRDLALLELERLPPGAVALPLAAGARAGERIHGVGCRYDSPVLWTYHRGSVAQVRTLREGYFSGGQHLAKGARIIEAHTPINEGDSGGPLLNARGEVIGVAAAVAWENQGAGLFISVAEVRDLIARAGGAPGKPPLPAADPHDLYRRMLRTVALVQRAGSDRRSSAWLLDRSRRLLVTTAEAVGGKETVEVTFPAYRDSQVIPDYRHYREAKAARKGVVLAVDRRRSLALVEAASLPDETEAAGLSTGSPLPGDPVHAIGNPDRIEALWLYGNGCLRQRGRANLGLATDEPDPEVMLVQLPVADGEGGGPLFNERGELIGMLAGRSTPQQQIAYALPVGEMQAFLREQQPRWQPTTANDLCARGTHFLKARQPERAILDFTAALQADPHHALACSERGRAHLLCTELDQALADCNRAIALQPRLAVAHSQRAAVLLRRGQLREARADCDAALALDRGNAQGYAVRGEVHRIGGDLDKALADCAEAIWLDRKSATAHLYRGRAHVQKDALDQALADFNQALILDLGLAEAYRERAGVHWLRSDVQAALTDYNQAIVLDPNDAAAYHGRGRVWSARRESARALADYAGALRLNPRLAAAYLDRGTERLKRDEDSLALLDFGQALKEQPRLASEVLAAAERRVRLLEEGGPTDMRRGAELCRQVLRLMLPFVTDRPELFRQILSALAKPPNEEPAAAVRRLLAALMRVKDAL